MLDRSTSKKHYPLFSLDFYRHCLEKADILQKNDHFFIVVNYSSLVALLLHISFLVFFAVLHLQVLLLFNIGSISCYVICYILNRKGRHYLAQALMSLEIIIHAIVAILFLGWQSGFYVYIIGSIILTCLTPTRKHLLKGLAVLGLCLVYIGLSLYSEVSPARITIPPLLLKTFFYGNSIAMLFMIATLIQYYHLTVTRAERQLRQANRRLTLLASTDPLTTLLNRRGMGDILQYEADRFKETARVFCVILADIDNFKLLNDQYGHECGDFVLSSIAERLKNALREHDQVARWGGEEFLILLPETDGNRGMKIVERLQLQIEENVFYYKRQTIGITVTFGLSVFDGYKDVTSCINDADEALRQGKSEGKNRVVRR